MTAAKHSRRVSLKVEAAADSLEAQLIHHVKHDPITPGRDVTLRALKAFYLPWALEGSVDEADLAAIAQSAIEELQFRIFQIRQRYLNSDAGYKPAATTTSSSIHPTSTMSSNGKAAFTPPLAGGDSFESMREQINPADLDDF